jgi:hypothetical protein
VKLIVVVGEETVALVSSMVLGAETPIHVWEDRLAFKVFCSEDTAAYALSLLTAEWGCSEKAGLSIFSTYLTQKHGIFDILGSKDNDALRSAFCAPNYLQMTGHAAAPSWSDLFASAF